MVDAGKVGRELLRLAPFLTLSIASGATFDLIGTGAPLALRAKGMLLADTGWLQLIYLPVGLAFLWAPLVDRSRPLPLPHRLAWVVAAQFLTAGLLASLGLRTGWPVASLFAIGLAISVALSTSNIATQAMVVETTAPSRRAPIATVRLVGASIGSAIGIGLATVTVVDGLTRAMFVVAAMNAVAAIPFFVSSEKRNAPDEVIRKVACTDRHWRKILGGGAAIGFYCIPSLMLGTVPGLLLLDLGLPLPATGTVTGVVTTAITVAMMLLSSYVLIRMRVGRQVSAMGVGVVFSGLMLVIAARAHWLPLAVVGVLLEDAFDAGFNVPIANLMYRWAEGPNVATEYAVLSGIAFLVSFPTRIVSPMLASSIGWPGYLAVSTALYALATLALCKSDQQRDGGRGDD